MATANRRPKDPSRDTFGLVLKRLRERRGFTMAALSVAAGLSKTYVTQAESGARGKAPRRDQVLALAQALRASDAERAELLHAAGMPIDTGVNQRPAFDEFVMADPFLKMDQKRALIAQYETYVPPSRRRQ